MTRLMKASVLTAVLFGAGASTASAQTAQGDIQALANVLTALSVTPGDDLDFGLVVQGVAKTVDPSAPASGTQSGKFTIGGQVSQAVSVAFTLLPANLTSGANNLPITYTGIHHTSNTPAGGTAFVPSAGVASTLLSGSGNLYIFLGGTVTPAAGQASGSYSGTVTVQVAYVGY
jgi:hypothetical protein